MRNIGNILAHHKKLVIDNRPPHETIKPASKNQQRQAKSRSSEFNIHRPISKGRNDPVVRLQHRQSESIQNYQKLKLESEVDKQRPKSRISLQYNHFETFKNGMDSNEKPVANNFDHFVQQVLTLMEEHSELAPTPEERLVVSRVRLKEVMVEILQWFVQGHLRLCRPRCNCRQLKALLGKLVEQVQREIRARTTQRLDMDSGVVSCLWGAEQLKLEYEKGEDKLSHLSYECRSLEQRISELTAFHQSLQMECSTTKQNLQEYKRQQQAINLHIAQGQQAVAALTASIQDGEKRLAAISIQQSSIRNYAAEQHAHQLLRIISEDYHRIESDIQEYALYLQSNQLATDLHVEPSPFIEVEQQLDEQEKELNVALGRGKESRKEQVQRLRVFLEDAMEFFRRKDHEMGRLLEFRTKCVWQFVEHMKKWLTNCQLRQEFLGSLRKEFAADAALLLSLADRAMARGDAGAKEMRQAAQKLIENYKMGNSFY